MDCKCSSVAFTGSTRDSSSSADAVSLRRRRRDHESTVATSMSCSGRGIVALTSKLWCLSSQLFLLHSTTTLVEVSAQRDDAAAFRPTAGWTQGRSPYLGREASVHPTWLRTEKGDALAEQSSHHNSHMWPRFIGIGDGDFEAEAGWVTVDQQASVAKCGVTSTNLGEQQTEQYLVSGFRRKGLGVAADWEMACQRRDVDYSSPASFAMYPMQLKKIENGGIYGRCFDKGFVAMISLHPVLELYCKTGFPAYRATHEQTHRNYKYGGWITCDTLMVPSDAVKLFSLEEAISRGRYNPVTSTEWVGCSCPAQEYMWAYKASRRVVDDTELLSIEIKCAPGF